MSILLIINNNISTPKKRHAAYVKFTQEEEYIMICKWLIFQGILEKKGESNYPKMYLNKVVAM